jgi:hypothetical protein
MRQFDRFDESIKTESKGVVMMDDDAEKFDLWNSWKEEWLLTKIKVLV